MTTRASRTALAAITLLGVATMSAGTNAQNTVTLKTDQIEADVSTEAPQILAYRLNSIHNVHYYVNLVKSMREAILAGTFDQFRKAFYSKRE